MGQSLVSVPSMVKVTRQVVKTLLNSDNEQSSLVLVESLVGIIF